MFLIALLKRQFLPLVVLPPIFLLLSFAYVVFSEPKYKASALARINIEAGLLPDELDVALASHVATVESDEIATEVIRRLDLGAGRDLTSGRLVEFVAALRDLLGIGTRTPISDAERETLLVAWAKGKLEVRRIDETSLIEIGYTASSPQRAADIANAFASAFIDSMSAEMRGANTRIETFIENRADELNRLVNTSYEQSREIKAQSQLGPAGFQDVEARIAKLNVALSEIDATAAATEARVALLQEIDDPQNLRAAALQSVPARDLYVTYSEARQRLDEMITRSAPERSILQLERSVAKLRAELERALESMLIGLRQEQIVVQARRQSLSQELSDALQLLGSKAWSDIREIEYQAGVFENLYAEYLKELETVRRSTLSIPVVLMTRARPDPSPSWPNYTVLILMGGIAGVILGGMLALFREWRDTEVTGDDQFDGPFVTLLKRRWQLERNFDDEI